MTSVLSRKRPVLPGETLPPKPVKWPGQPPQLPPVGVAFRAHGTSKRKANQAIKEAACAH